MPKPGAPSEKAEDDVSPKSKVLTRPSSQQYAYAVSTYARRSQQSYLYSGAHYRPLALFLERKTTFSLAPQPFSHVIVHDISSDTKSSKDYGSTNGHASFLEAPLPSKGLCKIIFVRGFSSPAWLTALGSKHRIDPEFFRRHLDFLQPDQQYDLPALPSSSRNFVQLKLTTICTRNTPLSHTQFQSLRSKERSASQTFQRNLNQRGVCGDSIIRSHVSHSRTLYTIEQKISCCVRNQNGAWVAIIWMDIGQNMSISLSKLLKETDFSSDSLSITHDVSHPVVQHQAKAKFQRQEFRDAASDSKFFPVRSFNQSADLLASQYGAYIKPTAMISDPMYALTELFEFVACSENQFLNMMEKLVNEDLDSLAINPDLSFVNLENRKAILDDHSKDICKVIAFLRSRGGPKWPKATETDAKALIDKTLNDLFTDFEYMLSQAQALVVKCTEGSTRIINAAMLEESKKAILQAESLSGLTKLASLFVPTSFVCTFFGMNVLEFGQGSLRIWITISVLVPALIMSLGLCYAQSFLRLIKGIFIT